MNNELLRAYLKLFFDWENAFYLLSLEVYRKLWAVGHKNIFPCFPRAERGGWKIQVINPYTKILYMLTVSASLWRRWRAEELWSPWDSYILTISEKGYWVSVSDSAVLQRFQFACLIYFIECNQLPQKSLINTKRRCDKNRNKPDAQGEKQATPANRNLIWIYGALYWLQRKILS